MAEKNIFVAHSDKQVADAMRAALTQRGYDVSAIVQTSSEAVQHVESSHPDLALVGVHLEQPYAGLQVGRHIHSACGAPIVYVAADVDAAVAERIKRDEAYGLVTRPRDPGALAAHVRIAFHRHQQERGIWKRLAGLQRLLDSLPEAVVAVDGSGAVTYTSASAASLARELPAEADDPSASALFPLAEEGPHPVERLLEGETQTTSQVALEINGEERLVQSRTLAPVTRPDGSIAGGVWMFRDADGESDETSGERSAQERLRVLEELIAEMGLGDRLEALIKERKQAATEI